MERGKGWEGGRLEEIRNRDGKRGGGGGGGGGGMDYFQSS